MKQFLSLSLSVAVLISCAKTSDIDDLKKQIKDLKENQITTIEQQVANIKASLQELNSLYELLSEKDEKLGNRIDELKQYVNEQLPTLRGWAEATFSTIDQYNSTCEELTRIKASMEFTETALKELIDQKILSSENSIKGWVNEKLTGYWTIAETEAKLNLLSQKDDENLSTLRSELKTAKDDLTKSYRDEIKTAVDQSAGQLSSKIDDINQSLKDKISSIESRLDAIEARLNELEKIFSIEIIAQDGLACMPGKNLQIEYSLINASNECQIECIGENGWSGKAIQNTPTSGYLIITAPNSEMSGKVLVIARSDNKISMKALYFDSGVLNVTDVVNVGWQEQTISIPVEYNIEYSIDCGDAAWLSFVEDPSTKAEVKTVNYLLSVEENPEDSPARDAIIKFYNAAGQQIRAITVYQALSPTSSPITFADPYAKLVCVQKLDLNGDGEVSYFEAGKTTELGEDFFGDYKAAVTSFDELQYFVSLNEISDRAFINVTRLEHVTLPNQIKAIGNGAFSGCGKLENIVLPEGVEEIESEAFSRCEMITEITFPSSLKTIGGRIFIKNHFKNIILNEGLESLGSEAFYLCKAEYIYVPTTIKQLDCSFAGTSGIAEIHGVIPDGPSWDSGAYARSEFTEIIIGDDVNYIGRAAFSYCKNTQKVTIGKNVTKIHSEGAFGFFNTKPVYYMRRFMPITCPESYSKFYVPEGSKEIYKATIGWPSEDSYYEEYVVE